MTKSRRDLLKYTGSSIFGIPLLAESTAAQSSDEKKETLPGEHKLSGNVQIVNNSRDVREVAVKIDLVTPDKKNPTIKKLEYIVDGRNAGDDSYSNILTDDTPLKLSTPGVFEMDVETDDGRSSTYRFANPAGRIRDNERLSIRIIWDSLRVTRERT